MDIINKIDEALNEAKIGTVGIGGKGVEFDTFGGSISVFPSQSGFGKGSDETNIQIGLNSSSRGNIDHIIELKIPREVNQKELFGTIKEKIVKDLAKIADKFDKEVLNLMKSYKGKF